MIQLTTSWPCLLILLVLGRLFCEGFLPLPGWQHVCANAHLSFWPQDSSKAADWLVWVVVRGGSPLTIQGKGQSPTLQTTPGGIPYSSQEVLEELIPVTHNNDLYHQSLYQLFLLFYFTLPSFSFPLSKGSAILPLLIWQCPFPLYRHILEIFWVQFQTTTTKQVSQ